MNIRIKWLEWSYPVLLWLMVACFSLLACRNVVAAAATRPVDAPQPASQEASRVLASNGISSPIR